MKIRIKGNSIRLRLTQTEVEHINNGQKVQESVPFGKNLPVFQYALSVNPNADKISTEYVEHTIKISLPQTQAKQWTSTDQVGMEENINWEDGTSLHILIEKDFQCLHKRPNEDESDNFLNPAAEGKR